VDALDGNTTYPARTAGMEIEPPSRWLSHRVKPGGTKEQSIGNGLTSKIAARDYIYPANPPLRKPTAEQGHISIKIKRSSPLPARSKTQRMFGYRGVGRKLLHVPARFRLHQKLNKRFPAAYLRTGRRTMPSPAKVSPQFSRKTLVLCIDDDKATLHARKLVLEAAGYDVVTASSGRIGLRLLERHPVQVVILDYRMPVERR
jgi:CheY-like chemotaxis protein